MYERLRSYLEKAHQDDISVTEECAFLNIKRIMYASACGTVLSLITIFFLLTDMSSDAAWQTRWDILFILHGVMFVTMIIIFFTAKWLDRKKKNGFLIQFIQYFLGSIALIFSLISMSADLLVNNNITSYLLACLMVGTVLLIKPKYTLIIYVSAYAAFFFAVSLTASNMLISYRINGASITAFSALLSIILWRYNKMNILQKRRIQSQQSQLEAANIELQQMAYNDSLTNLPNRRYFDEVMQKEVALIARNGFESCLIMADIDHFKNINDLYGHPVGDNILIQTGLLLSDCIRKCDTLCRIGGEEFIVLLPQTTLEEAAALGERLRARFAAHDFFEEDILIKITVSLGVARLLGSRSAPLIKQYTNVDKALYLAKQSGRNCVRTL